MIVSASYRTDIPALYAPWFENRFRAGYCMVKNPYGGKTSRIALKDGVDGYVFWTRNAKPFLPALAMVREAGLPFVIQYTATGYPRWLEKSVSNKALTVDTMRQIAELYGPDALVWRYDPIAITSITPPEWHIDNFTDLATGLAGTTDEVVVSFVQPYAKTLRNMRASEKEGGFSVRWPEQDEKISLITSLTAIATAHGMRLTLCTQPGLADAAPAAACIDAVRLSRIAGHPIAVRRKGNRPGCLCAQSRDIGSYDSCTQGCAYCYAVSAHSVAKAAFTEHRPEDESLTYTR